MKTLILTFGLIIGLLGTSSGQGYVSVVGTYSNSTNNTALWFNYTGGVAGGSGALGPIASTAAGGAYTVALLTAAFTGTTNSTQLLGNSSAINSWLDTGLLGHNNTFTGRLFIGNDIVAAHAPIGQTNQWLLVAWSTSLGATWSAVSSQLASVNFSSFGYLGWSTVGIGAAGDVPPFLPLDIQNNNPSAIIPTGMDLLAIPVPEPAAVTLIGIGALSLLALRRQRSKQS